MPIRVRVCNVPWLISMKKFKLVKALACAAAFAKINLPAPVLVSRVFQGIPPSLTYNVPFKVVSPTMFQDMLVVYKSLARVIGLTLAFRHTGAVAPLLVK